MAQSALNGRMELDADTWVLVSEVNCTFVVEDGTVEVIGMAAAAPTDERGITYRRGEGEEAATDVLGRFTGAGTADRLYAISRGKAASLFVSRAAVA